MKNLRENKGITLVALVITIIILIILSGISIAELTGNGLLSRAIEAKLEVKRSQISEWLNLKLVEEQSKHTQGTTEEIIEATRKNINYNIGELEELGKDIKIPENISTEENGKEVEAYFYVEVDKDVYKVCLEGVAFIGESGKLPPEIEITKITSTTNSITVEVTTTRNEGGNIEYCIKSEDEDDTKYKKAKKDSTETNYIFTGLEQNKTYNIKIIAIAKNGQKAEVTTTEKVGSVTEIKQGDITFTLNPSGWTKGNVTVTAQVKSGVDITGFTLQTSKDGTNYTSTATQTFTTNGTMYARVIDSTEQYKGIATRDIESIDTTKPVVTAATATTNSLTFTAKDTAGTNEQASGIIGYAITKSTTTPTSFTSVTNTKEITNKTVSQTTAGEKIVQGTTYYVWVKDEAENISASKSTSTKTVTEIKQGDIIFTLNPRGWTNGSVTVTAQVKEGIDTTGFTLQTSKDGTNYTSTANQTFITNGTIYARLIDSTGQYKGIATRDIENIEKTAPTISLGANFNTTYSKTQSVEVILADNESGLANEINVKYGWSTSYTTEPTTYTTVKINSDGEKSKTFTAVGSGYTGQYYLWVVPITVKDVAGNSNETKVISSGAFAFDNTAPTITSLTKSDVNWSGSTGTVTLTASAKEKETQIIAYKFTTDGNITALSDNWSFITPPSSETTQTMDVSIGTVWYFYVSDKLGNISKTSIDLVPHPSYGTTIQSNYSNIYISDNPQQAVNGTNNRDTYYAGNYNKMNAMLDNIKAIDERIDTGEQNTGAWLSRIYSGTNTNTLSSNVSNRWICVRFRGGGSTRGVSISNFKINFSNGSVLTIKEAVDNKYIEPLVLYQSAEAISSYKWNNIDNIITGGSTEIADYPGAYIIFKAKDKPIKSITFTTNKDWHEANDGIGIYKIKENYEFSIAPF